MAKRDCCPGCPGRDTSGCEYPMCQYQIRHNEHKPKKSATPAKARACETCKWFDTSTQPADKERDTHGICRAVVPVADDRTGHARWPFVEDTDWCSSWYDAKSV